ncbi:MAG TPA: PqqD family protein [Myxococcota bacterium]|nr:PqqD family protein [Myxococcota bacterium]HRY97191.1 PqqD family protein [Myxococcota bacterium]HSA23283.1 PqqD family protein [Myxococcota bacterium]
MASPRYRKTGAMAARKILDEVVLIPIRTDTRETLGAYHLNRTASVLWESLEREASLDDLVTALCTRFQVEAPQARADAEGFVQEMLRIGALEAGAEAGPA